MALGQYRRPPELRDEDKWFKFFTKTQLLGVGIALLIAGYLLIFFSTHGLFAIGFGLAFIIMLFAIIIMMFQMPKEKYLLGGGEELRTLLFRIIRKRLRKNRKIYVNNGKSDYK